MSVSLFILTVVITITFSAIHSGLNIALMSLNLNELKRKARLDDKKARLIYPLRKNAHLTLAAILLSNTAFASATALVLGSKLNGFVAGIISSLLLVVFGELLPQAMFTRKALNIIYIFYPLIKFDLYVTYIISKPLQLLMDKLFAPNSNKELHTRHELALLIHEHLGERESELDEDEVEIMKGALKLSEKQVSDIMTPIRHTYWLSSSSTLDGDKIEEIKNAGWSRIPIFNEKLSVCYGNLLVKDLIDIDFDAKPLKVKDFNLHRTKSVGSRTALDTMFRKFISARTHLMPVEKNGDIVGIVTIEDLIEEIIGHEIIDESDIQTKNLLK